MSPKSKLMSEDVVYLIRAKNKCIETVNSDTNDELKDIYMDLLEKKNIKDEDLLFRIDHRDSQFECFYGEDTYYGMYHHEVILLFQKLFKDIISDNMKKELDRLVGVHCI